MNPYVFFVGCPRSGTTLLRRIGDAHPELAMVGELHWLPQWWERRIGITEDGLVTKSLLDGLFSHPRWRKLDVAAERVADLVDEERPKQYARFVTELFDLHGQAKGKRFVGEKTPGYVRSLPTLHSLWPDARVVHLIRDGRNVALSLLDWSRADRIFRRYPMWQEDRITTAALFWEWNVRLGREAAAFLGPGSYYEVRYEALVSNPESECAKLCDFLALAYDPAMLRFHEGRTKSQPGLSAKNAWQPITAGLRSWRDQMEPDDLRRFEAPAGELLAELDYPSRSSPSGNDLGRAAELRAAFSNHLSARRRRVPDAWKEAA